MRHSLKVLAEKGESVQFAEVQVKGQQERCQQFAVKREAVQQLLLNSKRKKLVESKERYPRKVLIRVELVRVE